MSIKSYADVIAEDTNYEKAQQAIVDDGNKYLEEVHKLGKLIFLRINMQKQFLHIKIRRMYMMMAVRILGLRIQKVSTSRM